MDELANNEDVDNMSCYMVYDGNNDSFNAPTCIANDLDPNNMKGTIILGSGASCNMFNSSILMTEYRNLNYNTFKITGFKGSTESAIGSEI